MNIPAPSLNTGKGFLVFVGGVLVALFVIGQVDRLRIIAGISKGTLEPPRA